MLSRGEEDGNLTHPTCSHTHIITNLLSWCRLSIIKDKAYYPQLPGAGAGTRPTAAEDQMTELVVGLVTAERELWLRAEPYEGFCKGTTGENENITLRLFS